MGEWPVVLLWLGLGTALALYLLLFALARRPVSLRPARLAAGVVVFWLVLAVCGYSSALAEDIGWCLLVLGQPGKRYSFKTEGGVQSTWTYEAAPEGNGTRLTIRVEYQPPEGVLSRLRGTAAQSRHQAKADLVMQNLKTILDR